MADIDSYLLKCTLEAMETGVPTKKIARLCAQQLSSSDCKTKSQKPKHKKGAKSC